LAALAEAFARGFPGGGADVVVQAGDQNLIRRSRPQDPAGRPFCVIVEGLPNLMHEFVHAVQAGRLEDDHGIDYGRIPMDVELVVDRRLLWDELACCVLSCAYLDASQDDIDAWFDEQIGIQGVFWRMPADDVASGERAVFIRFVDRACATYPGEREACLARAYADVRGRLLAAGAEPSVADPVHAWSFNTLWRRMRARLAILPKRETCSTIQGS
jgi:hypothetical protein